MMKPITYLLLILISPIVGFSQEWAPTGAKWHYSRHYAFVDREDFTVIESMGDTIINGITAKHLKISPPGGCSTTDKAVFMYQTAENEIYAKVNTQSEFHMLYNFSAQPGDSWKFPVRLNAQYTDTLQYTVTHVGAININGHSRKILSCNLEYKLGVIEFSTGTTHLIEGIGDIQSMFPWEASHCDDDFILGLRCYEDNIIGFFHYNTDYDECDYITPSLSTLDLDQNHAIELFPNPSTDMIYFATPELNYLNLEIISLQGKVLRREEGFLTEIRLNDLTPGLYILRLVNSKGKVFVKQFVKQ